MTFAPSYCASKHGVVGFSRSMTVSKRASITAAGVHCFQYVLHVCRTAWNGTGSV